MKVPQKWVKEAANRQTDAKIGGVVLGLMGGHPGPRGDWSTFAPARGAVIPRCPGTLETTEVGAAAAAPVFSEPLRPSQFDPEKNLSPGNPIRFFTPK